MLYYPTMHHKRHTALVGAMTELDVKGMPFSDAKKQLLEAGYTEAEITHVLYSAPFDKRVNAPKPPDPLAVIYEAHPELADKVGQSFAASEAKDDLNEAIRNEVAANFAPGPLANEYRVKVSDYLGWSYYSVQIAGMVLAVVLAQTGISREVYIAVVGLYFLGSNVLYYSAFAKKAYLVSQNEKRISKHKPRA